MTTLTPHLLVKHSEGWNVDRVCRWMERTGQPYQWCYPAAGQGLPDPAGHAGVVVFGGADEGANDCQEHEWVREELRFIEQCLLAQTPFFGICLGAQMLARVLGARVEPHPDGFDEIGFHRVDPTPAGHEFLPAPLAVMQWHREGFTLPHGATHLARTDAFPNQAFSMDHRVIGVQFHPEVNADALDIWHARNRARPTGVLNDAQRARQHADAIRHDAAITQWLDGFLSGWTAPDARVA